MTGVTGRALTRSPALASCSRKGADGAFFWTSLSDQSEIRAGTRPRSICCFITSGRAVKPTHWLAWSFFFERALVDQPQQPVMVWLLAGPCIGREAEDLSFQKSLFWRIAPRKPSQHHQIANLLFRKPCRTA